EVHGVEPSLAMRRVAQRKLGTKATICDVEVTASPLPYDNDTFDLIITSMVLHEVWPNTRAAILNEARRVLKPEGHHLIIDYYRGKVTFPKGWFRQKVITFIELTAGSDHWRNFKQFMAHGGIEALIAEHPYVVQERKVVSGGNLGVLVLQKNGE
ncbi:MAG: class I SAM-dependent methyltransferase, partial [Proteobacteria bacterium]|nr:class I SAM-dependent methyltransferase [Pseudomonadota bacterium]